MENTISQLLLTDSKETIIIISSFFGVGLFVVTSNWDKIKLPYEWLMAWYKNKKRKDEFKQMLLEDHDKTEKLDTEVKELLEEVNTYNQNRVNDRAQSFKIQEMWTERIDSLFEKMEEMQNDTNAKFDALKERSDKRVRAELKDKIGASYRYYHNTRKINDMELEALEDLIEAYEDAGGENSFVHSVVQKEMYTWEKVDRI